MTDSGSKSEHENSAYSYEAHQTLSDLVRFLCHGPFGKLSSREVEAHSRKGKQRLTGFLAAESGGRAVKSSYAVIFILCFSPTLFFFAWSQDQMIALPVEFLQYDVLGPAAQDFQDGTCDVLTNDMK